MPILVRERFAAGSHPAERMTTALTGSRGRFALRLRPGPSRTVEASFAGTLTLTRSRARPNRVRTASGEARSATAPAARIGGRPILFRGVVRTRGATIPPDGKTVHLQFRLPAVPWTDFRTLVTDSRGRFRYAYAFTDPASREVRFEFRAVAAAQSAWPYLPAASRAIAVTGR
jgi:hypothetical protein